MLFSSITFLYYFLPLLLITYLIIPNKFKNIVLLIFSLLFYFYGEPKYIIILLTSCFINYMGGLLIEKYEKKSKFILIGVISYNIIQLLYFKYTDFFIMNINSIFNTNLSLLRIIMPLGISFFTFQTLSYVIDVYKKEVKASHSFIDFTTYVTLFPQLVAGPIVRYKTIASELKKRKTNYSDFANGIRRFIIGLAKKVLIANILGELCSDLVGMSSITIISSWINAISFTLQIYFDFSGYSDMAIGLGLMFGFHFLENFNYPFIAKSITDFWRRWHISLSSFFRDYVYIPLGGNRVSKLKWIRNILIVWFLTGFWHGASWNFILWGIYFVILLLLEKLLYCKYLNKTKIFKYLYTLFFVVISFTIFNANNMLEVITSLKNMFGFNNLPIINQETIYYIRNYFVIFAIAVICSTPLSKQLLNKLKPNKVFFIIETLCYFILLIIITAFLIDSSFNPFLYFRF